MGLRTRLLTASAVLAATAALTSSASAIDTLSGTRGDIVETTHAVDLTLSRGHAHLRVVREVHNRGERHDQAMYHLTLPPGAVATGLRTRGTVDGRPVWYEGELLEAELAAQRYRELTGIGGYYPKDPALLSWRSQSHLALQVFPCPPKEDKGIGYDLDMPTSWVEGREQVQLDAVGVENAGFGVATLRTDVPGAKIFVAGREVAAGTKIRLDGSSVVELQPPITYGTVDARLASVAFGPDRSLVALRFDAPAQISEVPRGAHVVVALDTSRSLDAAEVAAEMRAASAYLAHFENKQAKVALVGYARRARDLTQGFVSIPDARAILDGPALPRANGSAVDEAVSRATALFARVPAGTPKRMVVLGDLLARDSLEPAKIKAPLGSVVHVATIDVGGANVRRDDDDPWAALPRSTGGVLYHASAPSGPRRTWGDVAEVEHAFLELARPVRIDRMVWRLPGVDPSLGQSDGVLEEGASIEHRGLQAKLPANATIEGELWSKHYEKKVFASPSEGKLWSALVFGTEMVHELSEPEMNVLARAGGAVSPVTSYLAIEPGVRPSTEGLDHGIGEGGGGRGEGIGLGNIGTIGKGGGSAPPDYQGIFASLMEGAVKKCGAAGQTTIDLETTIAEVVDVAVKVSGDTTDRARATCVTEATWTVELPEVFRPSHLDLSVTL